MNLKLSLVKSLLEDGQKDKLEASIKRDKQIIPFMIKLVEKRLSDLDRPYTRDEITESFGYQKAYDEGAKAELTRLREFLKGKGE